MNRITGIGRRFFGTSSRVAGVKTYPNHQHRSRNVPVPESMSKETVTFPASVDSINLRTDKMKLIESTMQIQNNGSPRRVVLTRKQELQIEISSTTDSCPINTSKKKLSTSSSRMENTFNRISSLHQERGENLVNPCGIADKFS